MHLREILALAASVAFLAAGCDEREAPYLEFGGGGFIFNYRMATADYGFVARVARSIDDGVIIEAEFEDPGGGEPIVIRQTATGTQAYYTFRTPPVQGVEAGRDYRVELRLLDPAGVRVIARYGRTFRSQLDQGVLPAGPTVAGPGHQPRTGSTAPP